MRTAALLALVLGCAPDPVSEAPLFIVRDGHAECVGATTQAWSPSGNEGECRFDGRRLGPTECQWVTVRVAKMGAGWWIPEVRGEWCH